MPLITADQLTPLWGMVSVVPDTTSAAGEDTSRGGGGIRVGQYSILWTGTLRLAGSELLRRRRVDVLLQQLRQPGYHFELAFPDYRPGRYPDGLPSGGTGPILAGVGAGGNSITINGLPSGYNLEQGDYLSWIVGERYAFHAVTQLTAAGPGGAATVGVYPPVTFRTNSPGAPIELTMPKMRARYTGGGYEPGAHGVNSAAESDVEWVQVGNPAVG